MSSSVCLLVAGLIGVRDKTHTHTGSGTTYKQQLQPNYHDGRHRSGCHGDAVVAVYCCSLSWPSHLVVVLNVYIALVDTG